MTAKEKNAKETKSESGSVSFRPLSPDLPALLLGWYDSQRRILPWREDPTPYHVWVSEIMLQQTRVDTVIPYYLRFTEALPDVASLAAVPEERLLKLWEGLGYYSRARNLKKAAVQVMKEYEGRIPSDPDVLRKLAGIGPYTAAAIASIAFNIPVPSVDGNLLRVYARLTGYEENIKTSRAKKTAEKAFLEILPAERPGDMNQALMDLGAVICLPNGAPLCGKCPVRLSCTAHRLGKEKELPKTEQKLKRPVEKRTVLLLRKGDTVLIRKRPDNGLLAGLWEFPNLPGHLSREEIPDFCEKGGLTVLSLRPLSSSRHIFSHLEWNMNGFEAVVKGDWNKEGSFVPADAFFTEYSIPSAYSAYVSYLKGGNL